MPRRGAPQGEDQETLVGPPLLVLTSLVSGPKHGHALMKDIEGFAMIRLGPGTLYGAIARLEARGLITPLAADGPRRPYEISPQGATVLKASIDELGRVVAEGQSRLHALPRERRFTVPALRGGGV